MTIERAIEILDPEHREHYDSIEPVNEACRMGMNALKELSELKEKLESGRLVELPCKVGDTVYQTDGEIIYEITINRIIYDTENIAFDETAIGKMIFLSKEAAEARLKELQEEKK